MCQEYDCYWLEHEEMPEEVRPDRIHLVVTEAGSIEVGRAEMPVYLFNQEKPEAHRAAEASALLDAFIGRGAVVLLLCGPDLQILYDRARYPGITPRDIEVAYRYQQSQDAEELKRLGAVDDDFRPLTPQEAEELTSPQELGRHCAPGGGDKRCMH